MKLYRATRVITAYFLAPEDHTDEKLQSMGSDFIQDKIDWGFGTEEEVTEVTISPVQSLEGLNHDDRQEVVWFNAEDDPEQELNVEQAFDLYGPKQCESAAAS